MADPPAGHSIERFAIMTPVQAASGTFDRRRGASDREATPNRTGLPDGLKHGVEAMSGLSMDDVRVHRNSSEPAQLGAHAFARGSDIHLAPGHERHLPHEAWHVVQQKQGRVRATRQLESGVAVNDDAGLEREADTMGARAASGPRTAPDSHVAIAASPGGAVAQCVTEVEKEPKGWKEAVEAAAAVNQRIDWPESAAAFYGQLDLARDSLSEQREAAEAAEAAAARGSNEMREAKDKQQEIKNQKKTLKGFEKAVDKLIAQGNRIFADASVERYTSKSDAEAEYLRYEIDQNTGALQKMFWPGGGGFSAVGRASANVTAEIGTDAAHPAAHYLSNTVVDGNRWNLTAAKSGGKAVAPWGALRIENRVFDPGNPPHWRDTLPTPKGHAQHFSNLTYKPRLVTQDQALGGTSARAYAWISNTPGWDTERWEWLHIQGASLGGATGPENLVLGTRDSNTHMMPFESNLVELMKIARSMSDYFTGLYIRWSIIGADRVWPHKVSGIRISWDLALKQSAPRSLDDADFTSWAVFLPLVVGDVLSVKEVVHMQTKLKEAREVIANRKDAQPAAASSSSIPMSAAKPGSRATRRDNAEQSYGSRSDAYGGRIGSSATSEDEQKDDSEPRRRRSRSRSRSRTEERKGRSQFGESPPSKHKPNGDD